ncbi:conserved hypothetical protein, partial [Ricinus communis]
VSGLVGDVDRHRVDLAVDQVFWIEAVLDAAEAARRHTLLGQVGQQLVGVADVVCQGADHRPLADQAADVRISAGLAHGQRVRRMLEDHAQHHHRLAGHARQQQAAAAGAVLGLAGDDVALGRVAISPLEDAHVQAGLAVIAKLLRGVVAGELKLVGMLELQRDFVQRQGRRRQQQNSGGGAQPGKRRGECSHGHPGAVAVTLV